MFHIVQPCANGPRRFQHATIVSSHRTVEEAVNELARVTTIMDSHGIAATSLDLAIVADDGMPVLAGSQLRCESATDQPAAVPAVTTGWDFVEQPIGSRTAFRAHERGAPQIWWIDADGSSQRLERIEEELRMTAPAPVLNHTVSEQMSTAASLEAPGSLFDRHARSFWSDCQLRVRWPKTVGMRVAR